MAAEIVAAALSVALVVRLGDHVQAPFLLAVGGGLVVSVALTRLLLAVLLILASPRFWAEAFGAAARHRPEGGVRERLARPCR